MSLALVSLVLAGCGGSSVWNVNSHSPRAQYDGATLTYALPKGVVSISADFKDETLTLSSTRQVKAEPDFDAGRQVLSYRHSGLSSDDVTVEFDGVLLKKVASTTEDKTIDTVKALTGLLSEVKTTREALAQPAAKETEGQKKCRNMSLSHDFEITKASQPPRSQTKSFKDELTTCEITIKVEVEPIAGTVMYVHGYAPPIAMHGNYHGGCIYAVCFRLAQGYKITASASLTGETFNSPPMIFNVVAPSLDHYGYVQFNRRAFVSNSTALTFDNGILSSFESKNPSEVAGFFELPTELLKAAVVGVAFSAAK